MKTLGTPVKRKKVGPNQKRRLEQTLDRLTKQLKTEGYKINLSTVSPEAIKSDMTALRLYYRQLVKNQRLAKKLETLALSSQTKTTGPVYALLQVYKHINEVIDATQNLRTSEEKHSILVTQVLNPLFDNLASSLVRVCRRKKEVLELTSELQTLYDKNVDVLKTLTEEQL